MTLSIRTGAALLAALLSGAAIAADPTSTATITVEVTGLRNAAGLLGCKLLTKAEGFPEGEGTNASGAIKGTTGSCRFEGLAPGTYAVSVLHDENSNGKLDKNFFGVPTEGYGVSNNKTYAMSAPKWEESKFTVAAGETRALTISLRY
jgi:uncharacterized protein (DUF2141 family)